MTGSSRRSGRGDLLDSKRGQVVPADSHNTQALHQVVQGSVRLDGTAACSAYHTLAVRKHWAWLFAPSVRSRVRGSMLHQPGERPQAVTPKAAADRLPPRPADVFGHVALRIRRLRGCNGDAEDCLADGDCRRELQWPRY